jgi:hypothetical protein
MRCLSLVAIIVVVSFAGCAAPDLRDSMLASAQRSDPTFPDGGDVKLVRFAYVGSVRSPTGPVRVVHRTAVLTGMLAPRGLSEIMYFDRDGRWLGNERHSSQHASPLWTNGHLLFLAPGLPLDHQDDSEHVEYGNVIDFSRGFAQREIRLIPAYGSDEGPFEYTDLVGDRDVANPEGVRLK